MNSYLVLFSVALAIICCVQGDDGADRKAEYKKIDEECRKETSVDEDLITKAQKGDFEDNSDFKCYPKCLFVKLGFMKEDGDLDMDAIQATHAKKSPEKIEVIKVIEKECLPQKGATPCDTGDLIYRCYWDAIVKAGIKV